MASFPKREKVLIRSARFGGLPLKGIGPSEAKVRQCSEYAVHHEPGVIKCLPEFNLNLQGKLVYGERIVDNWITKYKKVRALADRSRTRSSVGSSSVVKLRVTRLRARLSNSVRSNA